jgi:uncharacterized protein DUF5677
MTDDAQHSSTEDLFESILDHVAATAFKGHTEAEIEKVIASGQLDEAIRATIPEVANKLADTLVASAPETLAARAEYAAAVADDVRRFYGPGLDFCEMVLKIASETGADYANEHLKPDGGPVTPWVMAHLLARACRVAEEGLVLLKAGFGPGASSRWRAAYEIAVVASFIGQNGDETASRYVDHLWVQRWRILKDAADARTLDPGDQPELDEAKREVDRLAAQHGDEFKQDYGWAALALPAAAHHGLRALADATNFAHVRPDYRRASASVHATASWVLEPPDADHLASTLATGPSLAAIDGPAVGIATTLTAITGAVMVAADYVSTAYVISTMLELCERATEKLRDAGDRVGAEDEDTDG